MEGHGETKLRSYRQLGTFKGQEGQGETPDCGQIAVKKSEAERGEDLVEKLLRAIWEEYP